MTTALKHLARVPNFQSGRAFYDGKLLGYKVRGCTPTHSSVIAYTDTQTDGGFNLRQSSGFRYRPLYNTSIYRFKLRFRFRTIIQYRSKVWYHPPETDFVFWIHKKAPSKNAAWENWCPIYYATHQTSTTRSPWLKLYTSWKPKI